MRVFLILPLSAALLGGCLTSQENPNYQHSTTYRGDQAGQNQYASAAPAPISYQPAPVSYQSAPVSYESAPTQDFPAQPYPVQTSSVASTVSAVAPTDSLYGATEVNGTPGYMALQSARQNVAPEAVAKTTTLAATSLGGANGAGTPIAYDYSRNLVSADAITTGQQIPNTARLLGKAAQNYTVQQGDTVYSLSRKTCVGVNVIQSMNGLNTNFAIQIGQPLALPASVC